MLYYAMLCYARYTPAYWRAAPDAYVRDAMVYSRLLAERQPEVGALLQQACVVPEAYASKWFIGRILEFKPLAIVHRNQAVLRRDCGARANRLD